MGVAFELAFGSVPPVTPGNGYSTRGTSRSALVQRYTRAICLTGIFKRPGRENKRVGSAEAPPTNLPPFYEKVSLISRCDYPKGSVSRHPGQQTTSTSLRRADLHFNNRNIVALFGIFSKSLETAGYAFDATGIIVFTRDK